MVIRRLPISGGSGFLPGLLPHHIGGVGKGGFLPPRSGVVIGAGGLVPRLRLLGRILGGYLFGPDVGLLWLALGEGGFRPASRLLRMKFVVIGAVIQTVVFVLLHVVTSPYRVFPAGFLMSSSYGRFVKKV